MVDSAADAEDISVLLKTALYEDRSGKKTLLLTLHLPENHQVFFSNTVIQ